MSENREKNNRILIITLCLVHLLLGLDINIVSVSLPTIAAKFDVTAGIATRVVWIYFLVLTCLLLGYGKLGDLKGFRNIYLTGILIFTLSSLLASFSYDFNFLVLSRILQALGAGTLFALTPAIITAFIKPEKRGRIFGLNYSFTAFGGIIGRALSGYLVEYFGWNSIFLINIPIGITALALGYYSLPAEKIINIKNKFDFTGSILIFLPLFGFLYVINTVQDFGFFSFEILGIIILSIIFFIAFLIYEKKISSYLCNHHSLFQF